MNKNVTLYPMPERGRNHFEFEVRLQRGCAIRGELELVGDGARITRYKPTSLFFAAPVVREPGETLTDALFRTMDHEVRRFWERDANLHADAERVRPFAHVLEQIYDNGPPASFLHIGRATHSVHEQAFVNDFTLGAYAGRLLRYTTDEDDVPYKTVCILYHPNGNNMLSFATTSQNSVSDIFSAGSPRIERLLQIVAMDDDPRLQAVRARLLPCRRA